ncbi:hypothetical protein EJ08DRAFT_665576 [Tothia fuscella]|uniref:DUF7730 domain-containing protein n=1 Tax=Tothia fuscella TaxID=1048955 RepID=A0A9P4NG76_9PEZI|nr:hypothetical protein EJ08DRAFT_665576 [Tothia fuscella]
MLLLPSKLFPFFQKFPKEVRDLIYKFVLADRMVHIGWEVNPLANDSDTTAQLRNEGKVYHSLCRCRQTGEDVHDMFKNSADKLSALFAFDRHRACIFSPSNHKAGNFHDTYDDPPLDNYGPVMTEIPGTGLDLLDTSYLTVALLRSCRRIYYEAGLLIYNANTFSFRNLLSFAVFIATLFPAQARQIKSIHVETRLEYPDRQWQHSIAHPRTTLDLLGNLRHVQVDMELAWDSADVSSSAKYYIQKHSDLGKHADDGFLEFRRCHLDTARVILGPSGNLAEMRDLATTIEKGLLEKWDEHAHRDKIMKVYEANLVTKKEKLAAAIIQGKMKPEVRAKQEAEIRKSEAWQAKMIASVAKKNEKALAIEAGK